MQAITYTAARQNLAKTMEKVCNDHAPVIVTRKTSNSVVKKVFWKSVTTPLSVSAVRSTEELKQH